MEIPDIRDKAHHVCVDYLGGIWTNLKPDDIIIEKIHGGLINYMFKLTLSPDCQPIGDEPKQVFMKIFSDNLKLGPFGIMTENIIVLLLAEKNIAPKVYGIFDGGRLEEFIESRNLTSNDFDDPKILENIMRNLAQLHCLKPPVSKEPISQWDQRLIDIFHQVIKNNGTDEIKNDLELHKLFERFMTLKPQEEFDWLTKLQDTVKSSIVFSHNDFHMNNMLFLTSANESSNDRIRFVDYELSGYNFRASDLTRLLTSFCFEIVPEPPYIKLNWEKYPTEEKQKEIFKCYLNEIQKQTKCSMDMDEAIKQLSKEVEVLRLLRHFVGIPICLQNPIQSKVKLDLTCHVEKMIDVYLKEKEKFLNSREK